MEENKKMHEVLEEIAEKFACMPQLVISFQGLEKEIRYYNCYEWEEGTTKERLLQKQQTLLKVAREIDVVDLQILFYLRALGGGNKYKLRKALKKQFKAECDFYNELYQTQEKFDICAVGEHREHKVSARARKKTEKLKKYVKNLAK